MLCPGGCVIRAECRSYGHVVHLTTCQILWLWLSILHIQATHARLKYSCAFAYLNCGHAGTTRTIMLRWCQIWRSTQGRLARSNRQHWSSRSRRKLVEAGPPSMALCGPSSNWWLCCHHRGPPHRRFFPNNNSTHQRSDMHLAMLSDRKWVRLRSLVECCALEVLDVQHIPFGRDPSASSLLQWCCRPADSSRQCAVRGAICIGTTPALYRTSRGIRSSTTYVDWANWWSWPQQNLLRCCCSAGCLPYKLARLLQEARHAHATGCDGVAAALADMFPPDLSPLIDMAGKRWAHTVRLGTCMVCHDKSWERGPAIMLTFWTMSASMQADCSSRSLQVWSICLLRLSSTGMANGLCNCPIFHPNYCRVQARPGDLNQSVWNLLNQHLPKLDRIHL